MDERGWGWTASEIRRAQLAEWIAQRPLAVQFTPEEFYNALPGQEMNAGDVAFGDLKQLEAHSLITFTPGLNPSSMPGLHILPLHQVRVLAEDRQRKRADRPLRRKACRNAMLAWLWSCDAVSRRDQSEDQECHAQRPEVWFLVCGALLRGRS
jgi:hypothetical protein